MRCPMCQTLLDADHPLETRPFCSPRCKKLDLAHWLAGNYRLPRELLPEELADLPEEQQQQILASLLGKSNNGPVN